MRTTIHDVARAAGTSITTVSRALNGTGRVSRATRQTVIELARDLDYRPGGFPPQRTTFTVAIVVTDITNPFFPELVDGITCEVNAVDGLVLICASPGWAALAALRRRGVDGMVLVGSGIDDDHLAAVTAGIPIVALDREVHLATASVVRSDHAEGARLATAHLTALGHRHVAHVGGPDGLEVSDLRQQGYAAALASADLDAVPHLVCRGELTERGGFAAMRSLLDDAPEVTAVFAVNDLAAIGAQAAIEERGLHVPADVSVVGFDDIPVASFLRPGLTTVRQQVRQLGACATRLLLDLLRAPGPQAPRREILDVELIVRETTARPREEAP